MRRRSVTQVRLELRRRTQRSSTFTASSVEKESIQHQPLHEESDDNLLLEAACRKELDDPQIDVELKERSKKYILASQIPEEIRGLSREAQLVHMILQSYPSVKMDDIRTKNNQTLLHLASSVSGNQEVVRLLLDRWKADVGATDWTMRTPLHYAAAVGATATVSELLKTLTGSVNLNKCDDATESPLHEAASHGNEGVMKLLLREDKIDVDLADDNERTALHKAVAYGHLNVVKLLLEEGHADPDVEDEEDLTPLHYVASPSLHPQSLKISAAICKVLIENEADVECQSESWHGETPLHMAAIEGHQEVVRILLQLGKAKVNSRQAHSKTPLHYAAMREGNSQIAQLLINGGANVAARDDEGKSALHYAVEYEDTGAVRVLVQNGADPMLADDSGVSAVDIARNRESQNILQLLENGRE